jgi:hypothetical protein
MDPGKWAFAAVSTPVNDLGNLNAIVFSPGASPVLVWCDTQRRSAKRRAYRSSECFQDSVRAF